MVTVKQPQLCMLGDNVVMDVEVQACQDVCEVVINAMLPEGVTMVRSEPQGPTSNGRQITWVYDGMKKGEKRSSRVTLRADREGNLCVCFCVTAVPVQFCHMLCARPVLHCQKCGPQEVCPGDPVHYTITVTNSGSCAAKEVVVTDQVPAELEHASGQKTLVFKLGTLQPCETKRINVCFTAVKRGKACNTIVVTACNANQCSDQFCTNICQECIELSKEGPKEVFIGKNADYQIVVTNPGDKSLTEVVVTDTAPSSTSIVEAKGASISGNQAVWKFKEMKPGEKQTLSLVLTTCAPGYYVNRVHVTNCQGCTACAEAGTRWKGRPALNACVVDMQDPVCVGDTTSYVVRVQNQGSEEDANVVVTLRFPAELSPLRASGPTAGTVSGQTVTFAPLGIISPRQTLEYRVDAQAKQSGDARVKVEISSDSIKTPIVQEESTIVS
jgi:conserved repeat domain/conserved repeat domain